MKVLIKRKGCKVQVHVYNTRQECTKAIHTLQDIDELMGVTDKVYQIADGQKDTYVRMQSGTSILNEYIGV